MALLLGDVVIAAPLASTTPFWALVFGALIFRREQLKPHHVFISMLTCAGAILLVTR